MDPMFYGLIELLLVFGGLALFGWHQLRSVRGDRAKDASTDDASDETRRS